jgi:hypothetical protein
MSATMRSYEKKNGHTIVKERYPRRALIAEGGIVIGKFGRSKECSLVHAKYSKPK